MEDSWELVAVPAEIEHSTVGKEAPQDGSDAALEKNDANNKSKVCKLGVIRGNLLNKSSIVSAESSSDPMSSVSTCRI